MSMRVPKELIPQLEKALVLSSYPNKTFLAGELGLSRSTITSFFNGKAISNFNFIEICTALNLNWKEFYPQKQLSSLANVSIINDINSQGVVKSSPDSPVKIVDISLLEVKDCNERPKKCHIDVKVRNIGEKVAYIKQANFYVKNIWFLERLNTRLVNFCSVNSTAQYDVDIILGDGSPYSLSKKISQAVKPNDVDRFTFSLGMKYGKLDDIIVNLAIKLIYNEDDRFIVSEDFCCDFLDEPISDYFTSDEDIDIIKFFYNKKCLEQITQMEATKSDKLEQLSHMLAQAKLDERTYCSIKSQIANSTNLTYLFSSIGTYINRYPF